MSSNVQYPHSAISSWSGFVYQGKIALYHCLKLILNDEKDFELQLDSTEDFAIYVDNILVSAHQVKAKVGKTRSSYTDALTKASKIEGDKIKNTTRYLHVSVELDDTSDHIDQNGETVSFYEYGKNKFCALDQIELSIKELTVKILIKEEVDKTLINNEDYINKIYCLISEKVCTKVIDIHSLNQQGGLSINQSAYVNRITNKEMKSGLLNQNPYEDFEYFGAKLRKELSDHLENDINNNLDSMDESQYERFWRLFKQIRSLNTKGLQELCQLIKPSEKFSTIQKMDLVRYSKIFKKISKEPLLEKIPYYVDRSSKCYLPTAIFIDEDEIQYCKDQIKSECSRNESLLELLYEYGNLIACKTHESFEVESKITTINSCSDSDNKNNIIKPFNISVMNIEDVKVKLNA